MVLPACLLFWCFMSLAGCDDQRPLPPLTFPDFDRQNAFRHLEAQVAFGPRVPGSDAHARCLAYMDSTMRGYANAVRQQSFQHTIEKSGERVQLTNLISSFGPSQGPRILLAAHWDCRPWADSDPDPANHDKPVPGANDGASGVAVLMEIARILHQQPPPVGVDIIFFDGEDFGISGRDNTWAIGSRYFARHKDSQYTPFMGILLDMIGDRDLKIKKEGYSVQYAPDVVNLVWSYASRIGATAFSPETTIPITDDHLPLLQVGIPCINIIDFDYPYHHTIEDTVDKCSPESLEQVGRVVLAVIYNSPL